MRNPPHPGEFIREVYLEPFGISSRQLASSLGVSPSTLSRLLKGDSGISPEMSLRLSKVLGRTPESWLAMQDMYDLWVARSTVNLDDIHPLGLRAHPSLEPERGRPEPLVPP
jgi:addiction module HigA family antidote